VFNHAITRACPEHMYREMRPPRVPITHSESSTCALYSTRLPHSCHTHDSGFPRGLPHAVMVPHSQCGHHPRPDRHLHDTLSPLHPFSTSTHGVQPVSLSRETRRRPSTAGTPHTATKDPALLSHTQRKYLTPSPAPLCLSRDRWR
jgi:hypothetical protein